MNKNTIIIVGIAIVLIGAALMIAQKQRPALEKAVSEVNESQKEEDLGSGKISGTLKDLFAKNIPLECDYRLENQGIASGTKLFISTNKVRADFSTVLPNGQTSKSFLIQDGEYTYLWNDQSVQGTKIKIEEGSEETEVLLENQEVKDASWQEMNIDYNCVPWQEDESYFLVPEEINFLDLSAQTKTIEGDACASCLQLPEGEARDQCLTSLNCE